MSAGKKFDVVIMNPPYNRSLHLKFLERMIDEADKVVSVQPVRWLEDPTAKYKNISTDYKKYENSISTHIIDLEVVTSEASKNMFGISLPGNLGIFKCGDNGGYDYKALSENNIIRKIIDYLNENKCTVDFNKKDGWRVRVPIILSGKSGGSGERGPILTDLGIKDIVFKDGKKDGKWWYEYYMKNQHSKTTEEITSSIKFNSENEAQNFINSQKTDFIRYVESFLIVNSNINKDKILWMGNAKNPRTGKIGYNSEWVDEDFNKFFALLDEDINTYHEYISDYEKRRSKWKKNNL